MKLGKSEPKYGGRYADDARGFRNDTDIDTAAGSTELVYFLDDAHWSPAGNRLVGQTVAQYVQDRGWLKP